MSGIEPDASLQNQLNYTVPLGGLIILTQVGVPQRVHQGVYRIHIRVQIVMGGPSPAIKTLGEFLAPVEK
jgi:hypothetical protein